VTLGALAATGVVAVAASAAAVAPADDSPGGPNPRDPAPAGSTTVTTDGGEFVALTPARLLDTRAGQSTVDGQFAGGGAVRGGTTLVLRVAGRAGVPAVGAGSVAVTVTGTNPTASTFVTAWPTGAARPVASNVNLVPRQTAPNAVVVKLGADGTISLFAAAGRTDLIVDVAGWFPESSGLVPGVPRRLMDTRAGQSTFDGQGAGGGPLGVHGVREVQVDGRGFVATPDGSAAVLNVTGTNPTGGTFLTAWPAGQPRPVASNLNLVSGATSPNLVVVPVGAGGRVSLYNNAGTSDVVVDLLAVIPAGSSIHPLIPARLLDTRAGQTTTDGGYAGTGALGPRESLVLPVAGRGGVPAQNVAAVAVNITGISPTTSTYVTTWPSGTRPNASNLNLVPREIRAGFAIVGLGGDGALRLYNNTGSTDLAVDVLGYVEAGQAEASTQVIPAGAAVLGQSDIAGTSVSGAVTHLTLVPGTPAPTVGQRVVVEGSPTNPNQPGLAGVVTAATGGGVDVTPKTFDEVFDAVDLHYDSDPAIPEARRATPAQPRKDSPRQLAPPPVAGAAAAQGADPLAYRTTITGGFTCQGNVSVGASVDLSLQNTYLKFDLQGGSLFSHPYLRAEVGGDLVVTASLTAQANASCHATPVTIVRPVLIGGVVVVFKFVVNLDLSVAAEGAFTSTDVFHFSRGAYTTSDLRFIGTQSATHTSNQDLTGKVSATLSEDTALSALLYGIAGLRVNAGPSFTANYDPDGTDRAGEPGCVTLTGRFTASLHLTLDLWFRTFSAGLLDYQAGPWELASTCLRTGAIQVTLIWDNDNDEDLHVIEPNGAEIWYSQPGPTATGGQLDQDDNVGICGVDLRPGGAENIYWPAGSTPDNGTYTVRIVQFNGCGTPSQWRAEVRVNGHLTHTETGTATGEFTFTY
jgi:hypothetical protein